MKYLIETSNDQLPENKTGELEQLVKEHTEKLERILKNYKKVFALEVYVKPEGSQTYKVRYLVDLASKPVIAKASSTNLLEAAAEAFESLRNTVNKQLAMERKEHIRHKNEIQYERFTAINENLAELKENEEKELFQSLVSKSMPMLKGYIRRRIRQAKKHLSMRIRAERAQDILDELYTRLYNTYKLHMSTKDDFYTWIYMEADKLLNEKLEEIEAVENYENVEQLRKKERKGIEEEFTADADGELVMMEEMDDPAYPAYNEELQDNSYSFHILSDNDEAEQSILDKLDADLTEEELNERVHQVLSKLPRIQHEVFDLYYLEDLNTSQISKIKDMDEREVVSTINKVREYLKENFVQN